MKATERRVRLRRQLRDRRTAQMRDAANEFHSVADAYVALGRPDLAAPYRESAALFTPASATG